MIAVNVLKNLKNIFRNWASFSVLILGPLLIIAILAVGFSSEAFQGVKIGYFSSIDVNEQVEPLKQVGQTVYYPEIGQCLYDLKVQKVHACINLIPKEKGMFRVEAYLDNGREAMSLVLLDNIKHAFAYQQSLIVEEQTSILLDQINEMISFMKSTEDDLTSFVQTLNYQLTILRKARTDFLDAKSDYAYKLDSLDNELISGQNIVRNKRYSTVDSLNQARNTMIIAASKLNDSDDLWDSAQDLLEIRISVENDFSSVDNVFFEARNALIQLKQHEGKLEEIRIQLDRTITETEQKIISLQRIRDAINNKASVFQKYTKSGAYELLNPLAFEYVPLFQGSEQITQASENLTVQEQKELINFASIQILFPIIIVLLVSFIAVILSNIIVLDDLYSPAYFRSFLIPAARVKFTVSLFLTALIISMFQVGILMLVAQYMFLMDVLSNFTALFVVIMLLTVFFSLFGMIIAYLIPNKATSLLTCVFSLMAVFILSGAMFPIERMSMLVSDIAQMLPITLSLSMLQQSLYYGINLIMMETKAVIMLSWVAIGVVIVCFARWYAESKRKSYK